MYKLACNAINTLYKHKSISIFALLCWGFLTISMWFFLPREYVAYGYIKPSTVPEFTIEGSRVLIRGTKQLTQVSVYVEEIADPSFYDEEMIKICGIDQKLAKKSIKSTINVELIRSSDILKISAYGRTPEAAASCVESLVQKVKRDESSALEIVVSLIKYFDKDDLAAVTNIGSSPFISTTELVRPVYSSPSEYKSKINVYSFASFIVLLAAAYLWSTILDRSRKNK